ncbi:cobalt-precorrin-6X reductase [Intrasporangium chromatireducens Q5-1]|uniref:Cobalt-precorrin-6X reductase n=1 Tax=Intrasporangium chromatireducens Q5-1 TaxID=584657 RepID=W9GLU0_9MICO|nr:cobalt-precorrin-6A reductase [Intrasporangium chromatireducens]EWT07040.1 cobalt-precorrin-6X reductase [Intrasporangium chromatireducens Q5-1]
MTVDGPGSPLGQVASARSAGQAPAPARVLILGGTAEARALAAALDALGLRFVSSLAGRVQRPTLPVGDVRVGGFGGVDGLVRHVTADGVTHIIDATHPFAEQITANALAASGRTGVPLLRLQRPGWEAHPLAKEFIWADDLEGARRAAESAGRRPLLTTGRQGLRTFTCWTDRPVVARVVDPPEIPIPASWEIICARGPFPYAAERALMKSRSIDVVLTKDSGGALTEPKLRAARDCGARVVVVRRPPLPACVDTVQSVERVLEWLHAEKRSSPSL